MQLSLERRSPERLATWAPLATGLAHTYGPIAYNYGIALYFLSYAHGFVKRGLIGELFLPVTHFSTGGLRAAQVAFTLAAFALTYLVFHRLLFGSAQDRVLAGVLLSGPALLPHLAVMFEQPDITLFMLLLLMVAAFVHLPSAAAAFASTALSAIALLVHEGFALAMYPLVVALLWMRCRRRRLSWSIAVLQVVLVALVLLLVLHFGRLKVMPEIILADAAQRTDVPLQRQVFDVMHSTLAQQRALVSHFYADPAFRGLLLLSAVFMLPYAFLLTSLLRRVGRELAYTQVDGVMLVALFLMPLALCYFGHDVGRWMSDCAIDATLFLLAVALEDGRAREALRHWATGPRPLLWLGWLLMLGPLDATAMEAAEHLSLLWSAR